MEPTFEFKLTTAAHDKILSFLEQMDEAGTPLRVMARKQGIRFQYGIDLAEGDAPEPGDVVHEQDGVALWMDEESAENLREATLDYVMAGFSGHFAFDNPAEDRLREGAPVIARIQDVLDAELNPYVASHGGEITLLDFKDGTAFVHMGGGCQGCGMAAQTLKQGVEQKLVELIPEVTRVVDTTDHASGENPYYRAPE